MILYAIVDKLGFTGAHCAALIEDGATILAGLAVGVVVYLLATLRGRK